MSVDGKISIVTGHLFSMVIRADFLRFFLDSGLMDKMTGTKVDICMYVCMYVCFLLFIVGAINLAL